MNVGNTQREAVDLDRLVRQLESHKADLLELEALRAAAMELPNTPPGFAGGPLERLKWTVRWVRDNHHTMQGIIESNTLRRIAEEKSLVAERKAEKLEAALKTIRECLSYFDEPLLHHLL